jgi:hypothetical protein
MVVMDLPISDNKIILNENHRVAITIIHAPSRNLIVKNCFGTMFNCMDDDEGYTQIWTSIAILELKQGVGSFP